MLEMTPNNASARETLDIAVSEFQNVVSTPSLLGIPVVIVLNKTDARDTVSVSEATARFETGSVFSAETKIHPLSCKTGAGMDRLVHYLRGKSTAQKSCF
ncbi:MAG: uncharacterized protein A8A55_3127 [Amphiamblys sp. WSBS2006]|nr:MAG: uncharacterized protein A8A55_3127 [Amphiamblys sp. WSBS2006]